MVIRKFDGMGNSLRVRAMSSYKYELEIERTRNDVPISTIFSLPLDPEVPRGCCGVFGCSGSRPSMKRSR